MVKIDNVEVDYHIDYLGKKIHLLDLGPRYSNTLVNMISPDFQKKFIKKECLLIDIVTFDWILYCGSGLVILYKDFQAMLILDNQKWLYGPFLGRIKRA
jgi:hypothetical protein